MLVIEGDRILLIFRTGLSFILIGEPRIGLLGDDMREGAGGVWARRLSRIGTAGTFCK
jgi:hypothetical protein